ncbi:hypothetical protein RRG08_057447 [Elysia crispata]|uniref:Uncharacterized protein n=1 Tax=Elysia crispata TaxID=231223 RepID=A0AAE1D990_9GAST|nr:hypothetical protein RRG08_057447 [Elysia crispata]
MEIARDDVSGHVHMIGLDRGSLQALRETMYRFTSIRQSLNTGSLWRLCEKDVSGHVHSTKFEYRVIMEIVRDDVSGHAHSTKFEYRVIMEIARKRCIGSRPFDKV